MVTQLVVWLVEMEQLHAQGGKPLPLLRSRALAMGVCTCPPLNNPPAPLTSSVLTSSGSPVDAASDRYTSSSLQHGARWECEQRAAAIRCHRPPCCRRTCRLGGRSWLYLQEQPAAADMCELQSLDAACRLFTPGAHHSAAIACPAHLTPAPMHGRGPGRALCSTWMYCPSVRQGID